MVMSLYNRYIYLYIYVYILLYTYIFLAASDIVGPMRLFKCMTCLPPLLYNILKSKRSMHYPLHSKEYDL